MDGDHDPLRSELQLLGKALERALPGMESAIARRGKPGPKSAKAARYDRLIECLGEIVRETGQIPTASSLAIVHEEEKLAETGSVKPKTYSRNYARNGTVAIRIIQIEIRLNSP